jgi:hypothetical protein
MDYKFLCHNREEKIYNFKDYIVLLNFSFNVFAHFVYFCFFLHFFYSFCPCRIIIKRVTASDPNQIMQLPNANSLIHDSSFNKDFFTL